MISLKDRVAKKLLRRVKHIYANLPPILQIPIINGRSGDMGTGSEMLFSNGSSITSIPTTEDAGRSEAVSLLVMDEAAIMQYAEIIWTAAFPTLSTGGAAIVNSCVTGDTVIIGENSNFRIDTVCPKEFGKMDIKHLKLRVLTHTGAWQRVIGATNKGELETWEVQNTFGDTLKCTPAHKLLTPQGWKPVSEIIEEGYNAIFYDTGLGAIKEPPITIPPEEEVLRPIPGFPKYLISNMGKVFINLKDKPHSIYSGELKEKKLITNLAGYKRVSLKHNRVKKKFTLARLMVEVFMGEIPEGFVVDHINTIITDNYITNLEIVSRVENARRATLYSRSLRLSHNIGDGFPSLQLVGLIKQKTKEYGDYYGVGKKVAKECSEELGFEVDRKYTQRVAREDRNTNIQVSTITLVRKYLDNIYDISVEYDSSYFTNTKFTSQNTPYGVGGFFYNTWQDGLLGINGFNNMKLTWDMHPDRDEEWYLKMRNALGAKRTAQEIDGDFLASGDTVFDLYDIKAIEDDLVDHPVIEKRLNGTLLIFHKPVPGEFYFIGADVATGRAKDYSSFSIMNRAGKEFAAFKGRIATNRFRDVLMGIGKEYNFALLGPEANDVGEAVVSGIQERAYPNLYYTQQIVKEKRSAKPITRKVPGWYTTGKNRGTILTLLEEDVREDLVDIADPFFVNEAYTFIYDASNRPVAMNKGDYIGDGSETYSDDSIMAKAITNYMRRGKQVPSETTVPK